MHSASRSQSWKAASAWAGVSTMGSRSLHAVGGTLFWLVGDGHVAVFSLDDLRACGLGRGVRVDGDARFGGSVGAPGVDVAAEPLGEAGAVRAVADGARAEAGLRCF